MSDPGGGSMAGHSCHENGLEVDVRYMRNDATEAPLNLSTQSTYYDKTLTIAVLQAFVDTGVVDLIYVDPAADITSVDVPGVVVDKTGVHVDHFHVRLLDPDGDDSNNC